MDEDPAYQISVTGVDGVSTARRTSLARVVDAVLRRHCVSAASINLALVNDQRIAALNERHLHHQGPTDVLTFDLRDEPATGVGRAGCGAHKGRRYTFRAAHKGRRYTSVSLGPVGARRTASSRVIDGEIVMSVETASREVKRLGHTVQAELALYAVHGTLHLLGYDDRTATEANLMHAVEDEILEAMGFGAVYRAGRR